MSKGETYQGNFEPLIGNELFEAVQEQLRKRVKTKKESGIGTISPLQDCLHVVSAVGRLLHNMEKETAEPMYITAVQRSSESAVSPT